jgi:hypothetical protein
MNRYIDWYNVCPAKQPLTCTDTGLGGLLTASWRPELLRPVLHARREQQTSQRVSKTFSREQFRWPLVQSISTGGAGFIGNFFSAGQVLIMLPQVMWLLADAIKFVVTQRTGCTATRATRFGMGWPRSITR